jgi:hypothetical protein
MEHQIWPYRPDDVHYIRYSVIRWCVVPSPRGYLYQGTAKTGTYILRPGTWSPRIKQGESSHRIGV